MKTQQEVIAARTDWDPVDGEGRHGDIWVLGDGATQKWQPGNRGAPAGKWCEHADVLMRPRDTRGDPAVYATPEMVAMRHDPSGSVCVDMGCTLSGGYAHAGPCEPCSCGARHAVQECPVGTSDRGAST